MLNDATLAVAVHAARRAGFILIDAARDLGRLPGHVQDATELATVAEAEAEDAIVAVLRTSFPKHAILGEASGDIPGAREGTGYKWLIDPLDGRANFAHGFPHYAVSIALAHGPRVTHAVVLDPVRDEIFTAVRGCGAETNEVPLRISHCTALASALVGTIFPPPTDPVLRSYLRMFETLLPQCGGVRRAGSCMLDLAYLAAGRLDGFWAMGLRPWQLAAGALLVQEAGGKVGDFAGSDDVLHTKEVFAAAPGVFTALRDAVQGAWAAERASAAS